MNLWTTSKRRKLSGVFYFISFAEEPKNPPLNRPSKYKPPEACTWKIALKYKVKQWAKTVNLLPTIRLAQSSLKRKFPSVDKPLRIWAPPKISPSKRAFEKYKPGRGLFSKFYGTFRRDGFLQSQTCYYAKNIFWRSPTFFISVTNVLYTQTEMHKNRPL